MELPQLMIPMSRAAKCQLRKICPNGDDVESEWRDSVGLTILAVSYVLNHMIFSWVRVVVIWEDAYLDLIKDLYTVITKT